MDGPPRADPVPSLADLLIGDVVVPDAPTAAAPPVSEPDVDPRARFQGLTALHLGPRRRFGGLIAHVELDPRRWRDQLRGGADVLIIEPSGGGSSREHDVLAAAGGLGIPSVRIRSDATAVLSGAATLEATGATLGPGGMPIAASVPLAVFNPRGWRPHPPDPVVTLAGPGTVEPPSVAWIDPPVGIHVPGRRRPGDASSRSSALVDTVGLRGVLRRAGVLLDDLRWARAPGERAALWAAARACGVPVLVVDETSALPPEPGVVAVASSGLVEELHTLIVDADRRERLGILGRRHVFAGHREELLCWMLEAVGVAVPPRARTTVLLATQRPQFLDRALDAVARQSLRDVDAVVVLHGPGFDALDAPSRPGLVTSVVRAPAEWTLGQCLNAALDDARGDLVAKMDDDDHYGPEHLSDLATAWRYSGADLVGKRVEFIHLANRDVTIRRRPSVPERPRPHVGGPTMLAARSLLRRYRFLPVPNRVDSTLYARLRADQRSIYGIHSRDFVLERHGDRHAWQVADDDFLAQAVDVRPGLALDFAGTTP